MRSEVEKKARAAKAAAASLAVADAGRKNEALMAMAAAMEENVPELLTANAKDMERARANGISGALLDRLSLNEGRIQGMAEGLRKLVRLPDPVGELVAGWRLPNGLEIQQIRVPLGVVGIIYEARPNVTADAAGLCLKAGNAVVLRGGSEAVESNRAIVRLLAEAAVSKGLPAGSINLIEDTSREAARELMRMNDYLDVLIPRGGAGLIRSVIENATVPVIETGVGNCHTYVDSDADLSKALPIVVNAKCSRPGVCNAMETLLVHDAVAGQFIPTVSSALIERGVELRGCPQAKALVPEMKDASEEDWAEEFLDYILAVKVVSSLEEALEHIARYGTKHSECIITENYTKAKQFTRSVDAAAVYVNASTRFTDGGEFGLGAEIGISTQKLHARGPMGLKELTSTKYLIYGSGQIRE